MEVKFSFFVCFQTSMNASRVDVTSTQTAKTHWGHMIVRVVMDTLEMALHAQVIDCYFNTLRSNNFRWLNAVKERKIVFFVRDNSGEKFLTAHAAWKKFSEVICRACAVVVHSWFSHLHGRFCVLALRTSVVFWRCRNKEPHSSEFLCRVVLSGTKTEA